MSTNEWITDRLPNDDDCILGLYVVYNALGRVVHIAAINEGEAWKPLLPCEPYVKAKRYDVIKRLPGKYLVRDIIDGECMCVRVPTREAAERIAAIYEEVMP